MHSSDIFPFKSPEETHTNPRQRCSHTSKQTQSRHTQVCGDVPGRDVSVMSTRELRQGIEGVTIIHRSIEGVTIILIFVCVCCDVRIFTENLMERKIQEIQRAQRQLGWKAAMGRLWWKCPRTRTTHRQLCNPHQPCLRIWCRGQNTNTRQCTNTKPH